MTPDRENIRFHTLRNAHYHTSRRRFFAWWNRLFTFLVVVLGAGVIGDVAERFGFAEPWLGAAIAIIGTLQLVLDLGGQTRDHQLLQREYFHLLADIEAVIDPKPEDCADWYSRMIRITAGEPPVLRAVDAKAHNDSVDVSAAYGEEERVVIPFCHRMLGHFVSFEGHHYETFRERTGKAAEKKGRAAA